MEYVSLMLGFQFLLAVAILFYLLVFVLLRRPGAREVVAAANRAAA